MEFGSLIPGTQGSGVCLSLTSFGKPSLKQQGILVFISLLSYTPQDFLRFEKTGFNLCPASSP